MRIPAPTERSATFTLSTGVRVDCEYTVVYDRDEDDGRLLSGLEPGTLVYDNHDLTHEEAHELHQLVRAAAREDRR